jgi:hypothetical protein
VIMAYEGRRDGLTYIRKSMIVTIIDVNMYNINADEMELRDSLLCVEALCKARIMRKEHMNIIICLISMLTKWNYGI